MFGVRIAGSRSCAMAGGCWVTDSMSDSKSCGCGVQFSVALSRAAALAPVMRLTSGESVSEMSPICGATFLERLVKGKVSEICAVAMFWKVEARVVSLAISELEDC